MDSPLKWYNKTISKDFIENNKESFIDELKLNIFDFTSFLRYNIEIENVHFYYNKEDLLKGISFYIIEKNISFEI
jgi:ABC-type multidrug transport system fused ATPase/permease subunit